MCDRWNRPTEVRHTSISLNTGLEVHNKAHLHYVLSCRAKHPIPLNHKRTWSCKYYQQTVLHRLGGNRLLLATGRTVMERWWDIFPVKSQIQWSLFSQAPYKRLPIQYRALLPIWPQTLRQFWSCTIHVWTLVTRMLKWCSKYIYET